MRLIHRKKCILERLTVRYPAVVAGFAVTQVTFARNEAFAAAVRYGATNRLQKIVVSM